MKGVLDEKESATGIHLFLLSLLKSLDIVVVCSLLMEVDRPTLQVSIQFEHD